MQYDPRLNHAWWTLRIGLGLAPLIAGLDKYFNLLTNWDMYLNPLVPRLLHIPGLTFMHIMGVLEIAMGLLVFSRFTRYAAYLIMAWLLAISANLLTQGQFFDIALRDIELSLGAFVLAKLTEVRERVLLDNDAGRGLGTVEATKPVGRIA